MKNRITTSPGPGEYLIPSSVAYLAPYVTKWKQFSWNFFYNVWFFYFIVIFPNKEIGLPKFNINIEFYRKTEKNDLCEWEKEKKKLETKMILEEF